RSTVPRPSPASGRGRIYPRWTAFFSSLLADRSTGARVPPCTARREPSLQRPAGPTVRPGLELGRDETRGDLPAGERAGAVDGAGAVDDRAHPGSGRPGRTATCLGVSPGREQGRPGRRLGRQPEADEPARD